MLHLGGGVALGVDIADLLELQRPFQGHRELVLPAQVEEIADMVIALGDAAHLVVAGQRPPDRVGHGAQLADHARPLQAGQVAHPAEVEGEHGQDGDLVGERLGAGHADLRPRVEVDAAVGLAGDAAADDVAQGQGRMALALDSRTAARVSAVSPDWVMARTIVLRSMGGLR